METIRLKAYQSFSSVVHMYKLCVGGESITDDRDEETMIKKNRIGSLCLPDALANSFTLPVSVCLSHTHTHTHTLSLSLSYTHTPTLSLSLSLTHTHTHTHTHTQTCSPALSPPPPNPCLSLLLPHPTCMYIFRS